MYLKHAVLKGMKVSVQKQLARSLAICYTYCWHRISDTKSAVITCILLSYAWTS